MPTVELSEQQVLDLVKQLPPKRKLEALVALAGDRTNSASQRLARAEEELRRLAAEHKKDWDQMTEDERETFVNDLVHEDRKCT
jgi:hypothetical protein